MPTQTESNVHLVSRNRLFLTAHVAHTTLRNLLLSLNCPPHPSWAQRQILSRAPPAVACCWSWERFSWLGRAAQLGKAGNEVNVPEHLFAAFAFHGFIARFRPSKMAIAALRAATASPIIGALCTSPNSRFGTFAAATTSVLMAGGSCSEAGLPPATFHQVNTTILPPARFSSMHRCASTISSRLKTFPIAGLSMPASISSTSSCNGVRMKSSDPPA